MIRGRYRERTARGRYLAKCRWAAPFVPREERADEKRQRALDDARGMVLREGRTYSAAGVKEWSVRRSVKGRTDQVDVVCDGVVIFTGGPRRIPKWLRGRGQSRVKSSGVG